jgi:glycosyltransferase involved in cell wall biosynthesis
VVQGKRIVFVGGPDIDLQLGLARELARHVKLSVLGSNPQACAVYGGTEIACGSFPMVAGINPWQDLVTVRALVAHFRRMRPDLVHTHDTKPSALGRIAARLAGVPVIVGTLPGMGSLYVDDGLATRARRLPYEAAQRVASRISELTLLATVDDLEDLVARGVIPRAKSAVLSTSGVDVAMFRPGRLTPAGAAALRASLQLDVNACVVTMVSRVIRSKGVLEFAAAAVRIRARMPSVQFVLVGPHDQSGEGALTSEELDTLRASGHWLGPRADVPDLLAITDIFAFPTYYGEGIPRVLLEAGATGLPIVTTATRGCRDVVQDGVSGLLVPVRSVDALEAAIVRLIEDPAERERLGKAAHDRVVADFTIEQVSNRIATVYQRLLESVNGQR